MNTDEYSDRLSKLHRHISNVQEAGKLLAEKLRKRNSPGDLHLAHELICNVHIHDASKFRGIEWEYLHDKVKDKHPELFKAAWENHVAVNPHHSEYWGGMEFIPVVYLAEWVCDTYARATEFGTDYREWVKHKASEKYKFSVNGKVYKKLKEFIDLLLEKPFS